VKVVQVSAAEMVVLDGGRQHRVFVARAGDTRWAFYAGNVWAIDGGAEPGARARAAGHDRLSAPMPATVVSVAVRPGDRVSRGETVVVLEAMKMELPIRAPRDGIVSAVRCSAGELVQPDVTLVEIE
jgi:3-methylcrotonyl-CoA carboxylase alpha subunit